MNQSEFSDALEKGLGRVYFYLKENSDELVREQLLQGCLHNQSYDSQCEENRATWLMKLISFSKNADFYISKIVDALIPSVEFSDAAQLYKLCQLIAQQGNASAKLAIYEKFNLQDFNESYIGGEEIIQMDGLDGLLHVVNVIGKRLIYESDYWESNQLYCLSCETFGKGTTDNFLLKNAEKNRYVVAYLNELTKLEERSNTQVTRSLAEKIRGKYSIESIIDDINQRKGEV